MPNVRSGTRPLPARPSRTLAELAEASLHVAYQVDMLRRSAEWLSASDRNDEFLWNAVLESFLTHARNLIYFLWTDQADRADDVLAIDFFDTPLAWPAMRPLKTPLLDDTYRRIHEYVAHLTYARRVDPAERSWAYGQIFHDIGEVIQVFINTVPAERLHPALQRFRY